MLLKLGGTSQPQVFQLRLAGGVVFALQLALRIIGVQRGVAGVVALLYPLPECVVAVVAPWVFLNYFDFSLFFDFLDEPKDPINPSRATIGIDMTIRNIIFPKKTDATQ
ncbi:hypothetical protein N8I74_18815 [Chitiniphilus purpureus]|uniref:Uncharacterized protein n=1 Tax=Chitiniphilus purpureus TaxID=2981137 RepID=A0ABY6DLT3_9NEIS|nr:hypothetical protein [Chitiniphilus sp. CD1]UXY15339.1 hypothetical protein N8I74_18815 [Chitiniphilus sp. CD1]